MAAVSQRPNKVLVCVEATEIKGHLAKLRQS
jgi:hypothetical protein